MKRMFVLFILLFVLFTQPVVNLVKAEDRFAVCDLCGYCPSTNPTPPSNWESCVKCLYPNASTNPQVKDTLKVDPATNVVPTSLPGFQYTMIGCLGTNLGGFQKSGAAAGVVQTLLNMLFSIAGGLSLLFVLYGAFLLSTSQADPAKLNHGKKVVMGAIVGLIFALLAVFLVNFIGGTVLQIPGFK